MNLYYIYLGLDYDDYIGSNNELRYEFQQKTSYIGDYLSKAIRKLRFKTDGTFNMISVSATEFELKQSSIVPFDVLKIKIPFDRLRYEKAKDTEDCSYYLELLEQGFKKASEFKPIPLEDLLNLIEEFKQGGCKNEWVHKKKRFKEEDLQVILTCEFTANYFQLVITINQFSTKKELVRGVVLRTETGVSIHQGAYKDVFINQDKIIITNRADSPIVEIDKDKVFKGILDFEIIADMEIKEILSYQM